MLKKDEYRRFYDQVATEVWSRVPGFYDKDVFSVFWDLRERDIIRRLVNVKSGDMVLDLACGPGRWVVEYATRGARVIAFDISIRMIRSAKSKLKGRLPDVDFIVGDAEHLPLKDAVFDVVSVFDAFPDFPHPLESLYEMKRVVNEKGHVIVEQTNILSLTGSLVSIVRRFFSFVRGLLKLSPRFKWYDKWTRYELPITVENWLRTIGFNYKIIGVNILVPVKALLVIEKYLEKSRIFNMLGYRLVFLCRSKS